MVILVPNFELAIAMDSVAVCELNYNMLGTSYIRELMCTKLQFYFLKLFYKISVLLLLNKDFIS